MNFNALIHEADRASYAYMLRRRARWSWLSYQLGKLITVYLPAMRTTPDCKNSVTIAADLVSEFIRTRCLPIHYFHYGLYRRSISAAEFSRYVPETKFYYYHLPRINCHHVLLDDKIIAEEIKRTYRIPIPQTVMIRRFGIWLDHERRPITNFRAFRELAEVKSAVGLIVKPAWLTSGGEGIRMLACGDEHKWSDQFGPIDLADLYREEQPDLIVQERCQNGGSLARFGATVLECFRVLTWIESGRAETLGVVLKIAATSGVVDNGHFGGAYVAVDHHTGRLGARAYDERGAERSEHPAHGIAFSDVIIDEIGEIVACAERAARAFSRIPLVGWDIGLTDTGPIIIEGNSSPGLALMQRPHHGLPILAQRLRERGFS